MTEADDATEMANYILGNLSEADEARLEAEYLADPRLQEELLCVEDELVDAYARGGLSKGDRARLENRFLASPRGREKLEFVNSLARFASAQSSKEQPNQSALAKPALARGFPVYRVLAAVAALLFVLTLGWSFRERLLHRSEQARHKHPVSETPSPSSPAGAGKQPVLVSILLEAASRNVGHAQRANIPPDVQKVHIQVDVRPALHSSYRVALVNAKDQIQWSGSGLKPRSIASGIVIDLDLPASAFEPGEYTLLLSPNANGARPVAEYVFVIEKR